MLRPGAIGYLREIIMNPRLALFGMLIVGIVLLSGCMSIRQSGGPADVTFKEEVSAGLEEIYVVRTTRTGYTRRATAACASALRAVQMTRYPITVLGSAGS